MNALCLYPKIELVLKDKKGIRPLKISPQELCGEHEQRKSWFHCFEK
jgi:hypothetical protein